MQKSVTLYKNLKEEMLIYDSIDGFSSIFIQPLRIRGGYFINSILKDEIE